MANIYTMLTTSCIDYVVTNTEWHPLVGFVLLAILFPDKAQKPLILDQSPAQILRT